MQFHVCPQVRNPQDISNLQFMWSRYVSSVRNLCSETFWKFFLPLHKLSGAAIDTALSSARASFSEYYTFNKFPFSTRTLFTKIKTKVESFWPRVMHHINIDLSSFKGLPATKHQLKFEFLDPIWAWVQAACKQPPAEMQWVPLSRHKRGFPTHKYYGGGLQYGK